MAKLKIGLSMLFCLSEPFKRMVKRLCGAETAYIEIVDDGFHVLDKQRVALLEDVGESYGIKYSVHAPFADINIASPSKPMLRVMLRRLEKSISCSSDLNAYVWVFHPGQRTGISMFYPNMDWLQNLKTTRLLLKMASDYGVKIAVENVPEPYPFLLKNVEDFTRFYGEIGEDVGLVLDIGHANLNRQIERFLTVFRDKIVHMHVHDNDGKGDQHLGIGFGNIDWKNFVNALARISYGRAVIIESVEQVAMSKHRLEELSASAF